MESVNLSVPRMIPKCRRRYYSYSSTGSPGNSIDVVGSCPVDSRLLEMDSETITGNAYLCFYDDASGFEGHLTTGNNSHYSLVGRCVNLDDKIKTEVNEDIPFVFNYEVTLVDLDDEESYSFNRVSMVDTKESRSLLSPHLTFKANQIYKGHKADMLIQKYLTPRLVGQNSQVLAGSFTADLGRSDSQPNSWKNSPLWYM